VTEPDWKGRFFLC